MNIKLLLCLVIFVIFIVIVYIPIVNKSKKAVEPFQGSVNRAYPNPHMSAHNKFIHDQSNEYVQILNKIKEIAQRVSNDDTMYIAVNSDAKLTILKQELFKSIYNKINFPDSDLCDNIETNECDLYKLIYNFLTNQLEVTVSTPQVYTEINNNVDTHWPVLYRELDTEIDTILNKNIASTNNDVASFFDSSDPTINKKKIIKRTVNSILFNFYIKLKPFSKNQLACSLYSKENCPVVPFEQIEGDGVGTDQVNYIEEKYKCKIDNNLCVNKDNNYAMVTECGALNGYGEEMCINTNYTDNGAACNYEELSQRCLNPVSSVSALTDSAANLGTGANNKCHLIYNNNLETFESKCSADRDCTFKKVQDRNGQKHGLCYQKINDDDSFPARPNNFCLSLSNIKVDDDIRALATAANCELNEDDNEYSRISRGQDGTGATLRDDQLNCHDLDESDYKIGEDASGNEIDVSKGTKLPTVLGLENQKNICEEIPRARGSILKKCKYVEYPRYIPQSAKSKYSKIGMCIPKDTSFKLNVDLIKNSEKCNSTNLVWSEDNNKCVDIASSCNDVKHKNVCNYKKQCLWESTGTANNYNESYELGYCRDLSSSLERIDELVDNIHEKQIEDAVDISNLEAKISKMATKFKNKLASLPLY